MSTGIVPKSLAELVDLYNASYKETYTVGPGEKRSLLSILVNIVKLMIVLSEMKTKYVSNINIGDLIYFKKDNVYVVGNGWYRRSYDSVSIF